MNTINGFRRGISTGLRVCFFLVINTPPLVAAPAKSLTEKATEHVASLPNTRLKAMLQDALGYLGLPYKWGGDNAATDGGFDCAGLAYSTFHAAGLEFPFPRFSTLNMTNKARGPDITKVWWTEYVEDFSHTMQTCGDGPFEDGDLLVYHVLTDGKISDRTGHAVIVVDSKHGYAISAAHGGVRVHALGDLKVYDNKALTACWRAPSMSKPPLEHPQITWTVMVNHKQMTTTGTNAAPYPTTNPMDLEVAASGPNLKDLRFDATGRVLSLIGFVTPRVTELAAAGESRHWRLQHDFKAEDLPTDPGAKIPTPRRKVVLRLFGKDGLVASEKAFYVEFHPYWY